MGTRHAEYPPDTTVAQARSRVSNRHSRVGGNLGGGAIRRVMLDLIQYPQGGVITPSFPPWHDRPMKHAINIIHMMPSDDEVLLIQGIIENVAIATVT